MIQLKDTQIWESEKGVICIQSSGKSCFDFKGVIFSKKNDGNLVFLNVIFNERNRLIKLIENLKMQEVNKKIIAEDIK